MYCKNCGVEIPDDANFCPRCGQNVNGPTISNETEKESQSNDKPHQETEYTIKDFFSFLCIVAGVMCLLCGLKLIFDL